MKQFKFVVQIFKDKERSSDNVLLEKEFKLVEDVCHFLEITKNQYNSLINNRVKFKTYYNKRLENVEISRKEIIKPQRKREEISTEAYLERLLNKSC